MDVKNKEQGIMRRKVPIFSKQFGQESIFCPLIADVRKILNCIFHVL